MIKAVVNQSDLQKLLRNVGRVKRRMTGKRSVNKTLKKGALVGQKIAQELVTVKTGTLKKSIAVTEEGSIVRLVANEPYAAVSEYKDKPYMRPVLKQKHKILRAAANEHKKNI